MSSKINGVKAAGKRLRSQATELVALLAMESLECRRLLCATGFTARTPAVSIAPPAMLIVQALPAAHVNLHSAVGITPVELVAAQPTDPGSLPSTAFVAVATDEPIQRLGPGGHFAGYDHPPRPGDPDSDNGTSGDSAEDANPLSLPPPVSAVNNLKTPKPLRPAFVGSGDPQIAPPAAPTPLALTPVAPAAPLPAGPGASPFTSPPAIGPANVASGGDPRIATPQPHVILGMMAMSVPANAIFAGADVTSQVAGSLANASNRASDTLGLIASADGGRVAVAYNFIHFNPATMLNDAMASFTNESVSLAPAAAPAAGYGRAWAITAAVVGLDLLFVGYWYQKTKRENAARLKRIRVRGGVLQMDLFNKRHSL